MKKNRYSKPKGKEVPSRRKLAQLMDRQDVVQAQQAHELRCTLEDLETAREDRRAWRGRAETLQAENERLCRQMDEMLPEMEFVEIGRCVKGPDDLMRCLHVNHGLVRVGVNVQWRPFNRRDLGGQSNEAFVQAMVDRICREVKGHVEAQFMLIV